MFDQMAVSLKSTLTISPCEIIGKTVWLRVSTTFLAGIFFNIFLLTIIASTVLWFTAIISKSSGDSRLMHFDTPIIPCGQRCDNTRISSNGGKLIVSQLMETEKAALGFWDEFFISQNLSQHSESTETNLMEKCLRILALT